MVLLLYHARHHRQWQLEGDRVLRQNGYAVRFPYYGISTDTQREGRRIIDRAQALSPT